MNEDKIEKIASVVEGDSTIEGKPELEHPTERVSPNKERFDTLMSQQQAPEAAPKAQPMTSSRNTLMDTVRDLNYTDNKRGPATSATLVSQTQEAVTQIQQIKKILESPNVNVKRSAQQLLSNKLSHIDESLRIALSKAGVEYDLAVEATPAGSRAKPIERFLRLLTDGQWQLEKLGGELSTMGAANKELSPVNMLAIQVKVGQIQQELELFSSLLNKALESIKTIMNTQV